MNFVMPLTPTSRRVGFIWMLVLLTLPSAFADDFKANDKVYIASSVASIRTAPHDKAPIAATLPIGTKVSYVGSVADVAGALNKECDGADPKKSQKWSCICVPKFRVDYGVYWCGWIGRDLLSIKQVKFADLLAKLDKTPADRLMERKKWAERAVAFDPLHEPARKSLIDVLKKLDDNKALESTQRWLDVYTVAPAQTRGTKLIFLYNGTFLEPIAEYEDGRITMDGFDQSSNEEFRSRGQSYNLYSRGRRLGMVVTEAQFDCRVLLCPQQTIARAVPSEANTRPTGLVTNFALSNAERPLRTVSKDEEAILQKLGTAFVKSSQLDPKERQAILKLIRKGVSSSISAVGSLGRDGRVMLMSNWVLGSMDDAHYGGEYDVYASILIIAEQQQDGSFRLAPGSGSIAERGCSMIDHVDIDGDGVDEIFLSCEQLEGQYHYALAKRSAGKWRITHGPARN